MRFEVELLSGEIVKVGGRPLMSEQEMQERFPYLHIAQKKHEEVFNKFSKISEDKIEEKEIEFRTLAQEMNGTMKDYCFEICKIFNPDIDKKKYLIDVSLYREIMEIWNGNKVEEKKK